MSNYSERKLQEALHQRGFYTQKAPSSGHGILDPETEEYIDQADIVALRKDVEISQYEGHTTQVLIIEEKHRKAPTVQIKDSERQMLKRIREITGGRALIAVKWKHHEGGHQLFELEELVDTGQHWKITTDMQGFGVEDVGV